MILTQVSFQWHRRMSNSVWSVGTPWTLTRPAFPPTEPSTYLLPTLLHFLPSLFTSTRPPRPLVFCSSQRMSHLASCPSWWKPTEAGEKELDEGYRWHLDENHRPQTPWLVKKSWREQWLQTNELYVCGWMDALKRFPPTSLFYFIIFRQGPTEPKMASKTLCVAKDDLSELLSFLPPIF